MNHEEVPKILTGLYDSRVAAPEDETLLSRLIANPLLGSCGEDCLRRLVRQSSVHVASRGTVVIEASRAFPYLGFVCDGVLAVTLSAEGPIRGVHRVQLYETQSGETFGEAAILAATPPLGDIAVISKRATYALFPAAAVNEAVAQEPMLLQRLAVQVAIRAHEIAQRMIAQHGWSVCARVARVLLPFAADGDGIKPANPQLAELTQRDIAAAAACVKEAAARAIAELEDRGALRRARGRIRELDRGVLLQYCDSRQ